MSQVKKGTLLGGIIALIICFSIGTYTYTQWLSVGVNPTVMILAGISLIIGAIGFILVLRGTIVK